MVWLRESNPAGDRTIPLGFRRLQQWAAPALVPPRNEGGEPERSQRPPCPRSVSRGTRFSYPCRDQSHEVAFDDHGTVDVALTSVRSPSTELESSGGTQGSEVRMTRSHITMLGVAGGALAALALAGSILVLAGALIYAAASLSGVPEHLGAMDFGQIAAEVVDQQIEAGAYAPEIDASDPMLKRRRIVVTTAINERTSKDVVERLFHLDSVAPGREIDLYMASPGGWLDSAYAIIDAMDSIGSPVNTHCIGGCYSASLMILAAGTGTRTVSSNSLVMLHANLEDSTAPYSFGKLSVARFERLFRDRSEIPESWYPLTGEIAYYLSPSEAVQFGLADQVVPQRLEAAGESAE